jgi:excisionase family DNA binding protein
MGQTMSAASTGLSREERAGRLLTLTVKNTCRVTGLGQTKVWQLIRDGRLDVVRIDGRTLVKFPSLERLLQLEKDALPEDEAR